MHEEKNLMLQLFSCIILCSMLASIQPRHYTSTDQLNIKVYLSRVLPFLLYVDLIYDCSNFRGGRAKGADERNWIRENSC